MLVSSPTTNPKVRTAPEIASGVVDPHIWQLRQRYLRVLKDPSEGSGGRARGRIDATRPPGPALPSLLCVDDDTDSVVVLADGLSECNFIVDFAHDAASRLAKIFATRPDLIVCSMWMRSVSGLELLQKLNKAGPQWANIPFVFLMDRHDRDSELAGRRFGADDYLRKPIDFEMLQVVVENRLQRANFHNAPQEQVPLTRREKEVLTWVAAARPRLRSRSPSLSERTVNFHCDRAMKRLDMVNRTQAVATGISQGSISI